MGTLDGHIQIDGDVTNESTGQIGAGNGGTITFGAITVTNDAGGDIGAQSGGQVTFDHSHVENHGHIGPNGGTVIFDHSVVENDSAPSLGGNGGITADGGGTITFDYGCVTNSGAIEAQDGSSITFEHDHVVNTAGTNLDGNGIGAFDGGSITFTDSCVDNTGFIRAFTGGGDDGSAGTIYFTDSTVNNAGGTISAIGKGTVVQLADTTIKGGTLFTDLSGVIQVVASVDGDSVLDGLANAVTVQGIVQVEKGAALDLVGTINDNGTIEIVSGDPDLVIDGTVTLNGSGTVNLDGAGSDIVGASTGTNVLDNSITIKGAGAIGAGDAQLTLNNQSGGIVDADINGATLTIDTGNILTNKGTLEATNGGTLQIDDSVANESTGVIVATGTGSTVSITFNGGGVNNDGMEKAVAGGTLNLTDDSGGVGNNSGGTIEADAGTVSITGGVDNNGTIEAVDGGTLTINIDNLNNNEGGVGNFGTIKADGGTVTIVATVSGAIVLNSGNGTIEAIDCGVVSLEAVTVDNSGVIEADGLHAAIKLNAVTINGGTLATTGGGIIETVADSGTSTLSGVTIDDGSILKADTGSSLDLESTTTINGTVTFEGGGTFMLDDPPDVASIVAGATGGTLDIAAGATFTGAGDIGNAGSSGATSLTLNNAGTIDADGDGAEIDIETGNTVTNTGLIEATNDGSLVIFDAVDNYGATPGTIKASGGGSITLLGTEVDSGSATTGVAGGTIEADTGSAIEFDTVATIGLGSSVSGGGGTLDAAGGTITVNNGELDVGSATAGGAGTVEASCAGSVELNGVTVNNYGSGTIEASHGGAITLSNGTLNDGSGTAGVAGGMVEATGCGSTITFQGTNTVDLGTTVTGGGGTVEATHGGAVVFDGSVVTDAGATIEALHGGTITFETEGSLDESSATKGIAGGVVEASGDCSTITFDNFTVKLDSAVTCGGGTIEASNGGAIIFNGGTINCATSAPTSGGLIEALTCGTITFNGTTIYNQGSSIEADGLGAAIMLAGATILGGTLETSACGVIETIADSKLDGVTIASGSAIQVDSGATLTLDNDTATGTTFHDASNAVLAVDGGTTLTLSGVTVHGGIIDDYSSTGPSGSIVAGNIDITGDSTFCGVDFHGGNLTVEGGKTLSLSGDTISGAAIEDGTVNSGGVTAGTIDVTGDTTFCDITLNDGNLTVEGGVKLTLSGDTISGTAIEDGTVTSGGVTAGTIDVTGDTTLIKGTLTDGDLTVGHGVTLTLDAETLTGVSVCDVGTIDIHNTVTLAGDITITGEPCSEIVNSGYLGVNGTTTLTDVYLSQTIDGVLAVNDALKLSGTTVDGGSVADPGSIDVTDDSAINDTTVNGATGDPDKSGVVTVESDVALTLDNTTLETLGVANHGTLQVDGDTTLTLSDVTVHGGAIDDYSSTGPSGSIVAGNIDITGDSTFCGVDFHGGNLTVEGGITLTLAAGDSITGTTIEDGTVTSGGVTAGTIDVTGDTTFTSTALHDGNLTVEGGITLTLAAGDTISGTAIEDGTVNSGGVTAGTIDVTGDTTFTNTTLNDGNLTVEGGVTLALSGGSIIGTTIEDGTVTSGGVVAGNIDVTGDIVINNSSINDGVLTVEGGVTLSASGDTISGTTINNFTNASGTIVGGNIDITGDSTFIDVALNNGNLTVDGGMTLTLSGDTINGTYIDDYTDVSGSVVGATIDVTRDSTIKNATVDGEGGPVDSGTPGAMIVENTKTLTLDGTTLEDLNVTNNGTLLVEGDETLTLSGVTIHGGTITDNGTIKVAGAVTIDSNAVISANQLTIDNDDTLTLGAGVSDTVTLTGTVDNCGTIAIGDSTLVIAGGETLTLDGSGIVTLAGGTISGSSGPTYGTLTNNGNTIEGYGQIGIGEPNILTLNNEAGGTIEALGVGQTLTIEIHGAIDNAGTLAAAAGATLQINVGTIDNTGNIQLEGTLLVAQPNANGHQLTLDDGGTVTLDGGAILGIRNGEILDNHGNTIQGDGNIGGGNLKLTLDNDAGGIVDANVAAHTLSINTGANAIVNAGTMEASDGGTLSIASAITNSGSITDNDGSILSFNNITITNTGSINLDGTTSITNLVIHGGLTLEGGDGSSTGPGQVILGGSWNTIVSDLNAGHHDTLTNVDNTISGAGTIGDADLTLVNQQHGVIDADVSTQTLTLNTGSNAITNAGTIEAGNGGILTIDSDLSNSGHVQVITNGTVFIESNSVTNAVGGTISADGSNSADVVIDCSSDGTVYDHGTFLNFGTVTSSNGGDIDVDSATVTNEVGGTITSEGTSSVFFDVIGNGAGTTTFGTLSNYGAITADSSYIGIESTTITNELGGTITADGATAEIDFDDRASGISLSNFGTITASDGGLVKIDTSTVTNSGSFEATGGGELDITNSVTNTNGTLLAASGGKLDVESGISGGTATIQAGTLEFDKSSSVDVTFDNSLDGGKGYGLLVLGDATDYNFNGDIIGFTGTAGDAGHSDVVELDGFVETGHSLVQSGDDQILTLTDANGDHVTLTFADFDGTFNFSTSGGKTFIYDPPAAGATDAPATVTAASGNTHTTVPANQVAHATDHATGPANEAGFLSDQGAAATATSQDSVASPANQLAHAGNTVTAPPPTAHTLGNSDLAAFGSDDAAVPTSGPAAGGAHGGAVTIEASIVTSPISTAIVLPGTPVLESEHPTDSTIVDGSGAAHDEVAPPTAPTAPGNEHTVAPATVTAPPPAASPTLASASLGGSGNDSFAFHPNLGSNTAQTTDAHTSELAHNNVQIAGPALAAIAPEFHQEFAFDAIHQDAAALTATVDQFHQMAANSTLLH